MVLVHVPCLACWSLPVTLDKPILNILFGNKIILVLDIILYQNLSWF